MVEFVPTDEQRRILSAFTSFSHMTVIAGAGSGKTTTLRMLGESAGGDKGLYVAFNKSVQLHAEATFPRSVTCRTAHALAYAYCMRNDNLRHIVRKHQGDYGYTVSDAIRNLIFQGRSPRVTFRSFGESRTLSTKWLTNQVRDMVRRFCQSARTEITYADLWPMDVRATDQEIDDLREHLWDVLAEPANIFWDDVLSTSSRIAPVGFGEILKIWQMNKPELMFDYILFDEAQDASPVILDVILHQTRRENAPQVVMVGDPNQAIYGFTGARDALNAFTENRIEHTRLPLSVSWRFGDEIASAANSVLRAIRPDNMQLSGRGGPGSVIFTPYGKDAILTDVDAVITRTNAEAINYAIQALSQGLLPYVVMDVEYLLGILVGLNDLKEGRPTDHPSLSWYKDWDHFQRVLANEPDVEDEFEPIFRLLANYDIETLIGLFARVKEIKEDEADLTISTIHKAKGLEWDSVYVAFDSWSAKKENLRLMYVAITRALKTLQISNASLLGRTGLPVNDSASLRWLDPFSSLEWLPDERFPDESSQWSKAEIIRKRRLLAYVLAFSGRNFTGLGDGTSIVLDDPSLIADTMFGCESQGSNCTTDNLEEAVQVVLDSFDRPSEGVNDSVWDLAVWHAMRAREIAKTKGTTFGAVAQDIMTSIEANGLVTSEIEGPPWDNFAWPENPIYRDADEVEPPTSTVLPSRRSSGSARPAKRETSRTKSSPPPETVRKPSSVDSRAVTIQVELTPEEMQLITLIRESRAAGSGVVTPITAAPSHGRKKSKKQRQREARRRARG